MNKPAPKEPSMDEILSSIRQIIAEDDAVTRKPAVSAAPFAPVRPPVPANAERPPTGASEPVPLALSTAQIVAPEMPDMDDTEDFEAEALALVEALADEPEPLPVPELETAELEGPAGFDEASLIEADDIGFELEDERLAVPPPPAAAPPVFAAPRVEPPRAPMQVAQAAPMPDPTLSSDLAEKLLKPATDAAVRHTFSRLGNVAVGVPGVTLEDMMRDMLKPLLKEWLDENLPSVVERMVEREIARISRGVE